MKKPIWQSTRLGERIAKLSPAMVRNPVLARLICEVKGFVCPRSGGFNDVGRVHSDYMNNNTDKHTDLTEESLCSRSPYARHTDNSYRTSGLRYSHLDGVDPDDSHTDSPARQEDRWRSTHSDDSI